MLRLTKFIVLSALFFFVAGGVNRAEAWTWGEKSLATINGRDYTSDDFKNWWNNWQEEDSKFPETLEPFINWHLLAQEAEAMELYTLPGYRRKVETFLKVRSLMKLKYDEIDSKIKIEDSALRATYDQECCPRWRVEVIGFDDKEDALKISNDLSSGRLLIEDFLDQRDLAGGRHYHGSKWLRAATKVSEETRAALSGLPVNTATQPIPQRNGFVIMYLYEVGGPDEADFEKLKKGYRQKAWKAEKWRLTDKLVRELHKKYNVKVDEEIYSRITLGEVPSKLLDKDLVSIDGGAIKVGAFVRIFEKDQRVVGRDLVTEELLRERKDRTLNNILAQTLTSKEAMARHYEEKPPIKPIYEFYSQNRLIKELENRVFYSRSAPTAAEIEKYYKENPQEFSRSGNVTLKRIVADEELVGKMWAELSRGDDFNEVLARHYPFNIPSQVTPFDRLGPEIKEVVQKLVKGEVSPPFSTSGHYNLIRLIDRQPASIVPLDEVGARISRRLRADKFKALRDDYLTELKSRSEISFNRKKWETIKSELGS